MTGILKADCLYQPLKVYHIFLGKSKVGHKLEVGLRRVDADGMEMKAMALLYVL